MSKSVLIIGGGIAGINCAINIAFYGLRVYLVEDTPSIGGMMARLDKTFPTNDCSICIESPQMFDIKNNKNIDVLVNTEVKKTTKTSDSFKVKLLKKATFVDEELCTGCGACIEACPVSIRDEMDGKIGGMKKLISMPFPQAVPNVVSINTLCRHGDMLSQGGCIGGCVVDCSQCRECTIALCRQACENEGKKAILLWQNNKSITIHVSAIIVATGVLSAPAVGDLLGYNRFDNVITTMEFERLMNAGGPTTGEIVRASDGKHAKKIGWVQCVGRGMAEGKGLPYCSKVCCMIACKQSIIAKEHDNQLLTNIYYNDLKAYGKNFWEFHKKSVDKNVNWLHGRPYYVAENKITKNLIIKYESLSTGKIVQDELDLLVLSTGLIPPYDRNRRLSKVLKINIDKHGFFSQKDPFLSPLETNVDGIYLCGGATGPIDISESVSQACAAAMKAVLKISVNF